MASVLDAFRFLKDSKFYMFKTAVISAMAGIGGYEAFMSFKNPTSTPFVAGALCLLFFVGYLACYVNNLINERQNLMVGFLNPFKPLFAGLGMLVTVAPGAFLMWFALTEMYPRLSALGHPAWLVITLCSVVGLLIFSIITAQICAFCQSFNLLTAFNPVIVLPCVAEFFGGILFAGILSIILCSLFYGPFGYVAYLMFKDYVYALAFCGGLAATFVIFLNFGYYAQIFQERELIREEEAVKRERDKALARKEKFEKNNLK